MVIKLRRNELQNSFIILLMLDAFCNQIHREIEGFVGILIVTSRRFSLLLKESMQLLVIRGKITTFIEILNA